MRRRSSIRLLMALALVATAYAAGQLGWPGGLLPGAGPGSGAGANRLREAWEGRKSGVVVELSGSVEKVLSDDLRGSRHQRFILGLPTGHTVLVTHNIDLAPRVEGIRRGDPVTLSGQYEWNERGGVVHWTHHDPQRRRPGGWIEHEGRVYR